MLWEKIKNAKWGYIMLAFLVIAISVTPHKFDPAADFDCGDVRLLVIAAGGPLNTTTILEVYKMPPHRIRRIMACVAKGEDEGK